MRNLILAWLILVAVVYGVRTWPAAWDLNGDGHLSALDASFALRGGPRR